MVSLFFVGGQEVAFDKKDFLKIQKRICKESFPPNRTKLSQFGFRLLQGLIIDRESSTGGKSLRGSLQLGAEPFALVLVGIGLAEEIDRRQCLS